MPAQLPIGLLATAALSAGLLSNQVAYANTATMANVTFKAQSTRDAFIRTVRTSRVRANYESVSPIELRFQTLSQKWNAESLDLSSITAMVMLPEYQQIIGLGYQAVPLILQYMRDNPQSPGHWNWALRSITGENPVSEDDLGSPRRAAAVWLKWASDRGVLL